MIKKKNLKSCQHGKKTHYIKENKDNIYNRLNRNMQTRKQKNMLKGGGMSIPRILDGAQVSFKTEGKIQTFFR